MGVLTWRLIQATREYVATTHLLGLNRSRISKLQVTAPALGALYDTRVVAGDSLSLPLLVDAAAAGNLELPPPEDEPAVDASGDDDDASTARGAWEVLPGDVRFAESPQDQALAWTMCWVRSLRRKSIGVNC
jgi:hypothetical protein